MRVIHSVVIREKPPSKRPRVQSSLKIVTECLLTRSMLIKMYLPLHGMCLYMYIVFTVGQCMQMLTQSII